MLPSLQDFVASTSVDTKELVAIMSQHLKNYPLIFANIFPKIRFLKDKFLDPKSLYREHKFMYLNAA